MRRYGGTAFWSGAASQGFVDAAFWPPFKADLAAGASEGMIGVVLATSPKALLRGRAKVSWPGCTPAAPVAFSMSFFWSSIANFN